MTNINTKFITNESGENLQKRFATLIKNTRFFDVLSGYLILHLRKNSLNFLAGLLSLAKFSLKLWLFQKLLKRIR